MNRILCFFFFLFLVLGSCNAEVLDIHADGAGGGQAIRELVAEKFPDGKVFIGVASHYSLFNTATIGIVDKEFSYVTPANDFKQTYIHPEPGLWKWEKSDAWVQHCRENNQLIRLHAPISPQCSKWVKSDIRTPEELEAILKEYMTELCLRYNNTPEIRWLDVVNETIDMRTGDWFGPETGTDKWENPWPKIGFDETHNLKPPLYIKQAFLIANKFAPNIKQIINQHGDLEKHSWEKMKKLVGYLRENNIRVDGLGWQAHINLGWEKVPGNMEYLAEIISWCHSNSLEFHITEFNVWLKGDSVGELVQQADTYTAIVKTVLDNRKNGVVGINFWQIRGSETMNKDWDGCLFNEDLQAKPAYFKIKELLTTY